MEQVRSAVRVVIKRQCELVLESLRQCLDFAQQVLSALVFGHVRNGDCTLNPSKRGRERRRLQGGGGARVRHGWSTSISDVSNRQWRAVPHAPASPPNDAPPSTYRDHRKEKRPQSRVGYRVEGGSVRAQHRHVRGGDARCVCCRCREQDVAATCAQTRKLPECGGGGMRCRLRS